MRSAWIDKGQTPDVAKLKAVGVERVYFDARWELLTQAFLDTVRAEGFAVGIYRDPSWGTPADPTHTAPATALANVLDIELNALGATRGSSPSKVAVMVDIEYPNREQYLPTFLATWRSLRPKRLTGWTMEGFQGGWIKTIQPQVQAANIDLYPQAYDGSMRHYAEDAVTHDLTVAWLPRVSCMYDAALFHPESRWTDGCLFTQGRLP